MGSTSFFFKKNTIGLIITKKCLIFLHFVEKW